MTAEICFKIFSSWEGRVGREIDERKQTDLTTANCGSWVGIALLLHVTATTWVSSLFTDLCLYLLKLNDAIKGSDSQGSLHKPLGSLEDQSCLAVNLYSWHVAARRLAHYWHFNTGCLIGMLIIQSTQLWWEALKSKLSLRENTAFSKHQNSISK